MNFSRALSNVSTSAKATSFASNEASKSGSSTFLVSSAGPTAAADSNHNRLFGPQLPLLGLPAAVVSSAAAPLTGPDLDAISLFDDIDFSDKPKELSDCLDDLADLIEEKSVKPMLAAVSPANMLMIPNAVAPKISEAERRRNDAVSLLKSYSVPDPLLGQLVTESMTGFIFVVDAQGLVEIVSDSSTENVGHSPQQIRGNTIYNFLHPADHSRFGFHVVQQTSPPTTNTDPDKARRNFTCRFKLQNPVSSGEAYITLYVACITVRRDQEAAETSRLLCVARKLSDVSPHPLTVSVVNNPNSSSASAVQGPATASVVQNAVIAANATDLFRTKLDPATFKVMHTDTSPGATSNSRLRASVAAKTLSMVGKNFLDFCHPEDRELVRQHFLSTVRDKSSVSRVYRMTGLMGNNNGSIHQKLSNVVHVQTKSKYHKALTSHTSGFINSTHSIVGDMGAAGAQLSNRTISTTSYLLSSQQPVVMMSTASAASGTPKMSTLSSLLSTPPSSSASFSSVSSTRTKSPPSTTSSGSPTSENSEEAKNQLLKQLLNSNFQPQSTMASSDSSTSSTSKSSGIMQLLNNDGAIKAGMKRHASGMLENAPVAKVPSVVCSENPSLTELLEKPPHLSITVPPPVPTKWHQEPREKLPKDIMRKFLPPHPAERAAAAAAAAAAATAQSKAQSPTSTTSSSALYTVLTSRRGGAATGTLVYTSNSGQAETSTSASTTSNLSVFETNVGGGQQQNFEDKDDMLSEILEGVIDFDQELIPTTSAQATVSSAAMPPAAIADERRISYIERYLASPPDFQQSPKTVPQLQQTNRPKMSSLAASAPSLTSILSAPPLAQVTGRAVQGQQSNGGGQPRQPPSAAASASSANSGGNNAGGNPVNLVPRMNELLQQVPPNVSIPDTPDLDSLILLQERRRRMSSGGSAVAVVTTSPPQQPPIQPGFNIQSQPPTNAQAATAPKSQLLMQHLTSNNRPPQQVQTARSVSYVEPSSQAFNASSASGGNNGTPQILARRSSFSGGLSGALSPVSTSGSLVSPPNAPPSGAAAAAAAAVHVAAASAGVLQPPSISNRSNASARHASGGTVHHGPHLPRPQIVQQAGSVAHGSQSRRLSDSVSDLRNEDKQRSLLQQLLSE